MPRTISPLDAPSYGVQTAMLGALVRIVLAVLLCKPLRFGCDHRSRQAQPGSYGGDGTEVIVVHASEGWMRIVAERALHPPRDLLIGQPSRKMQSHVDPGSNAS